MQSEQKMKAGKKDKAKTQTKHIQSQPVSQLQAKIDKYESDLKKWGVYYDYPEAVNDEKGTRTNKYRIMRTKGNTKNQRHIIKKQHLQLLKATAEHLEAIWRKAKETHDDASSEAESPLSEDTNTDSESEDYEELLCEMDESEREMWRARKKTQS